ncbi:hypothetical protein F2Q68_00005297 [Brassica cretica]|uniref:Uncharacterized protein n=1 Tax=Brassica cretica TaxID=69181 RepID=A0A8S9JN36_BRACR|nr:hypothetical protein F2Q68_00005297 [Brassica cretica]
MDEKLEVARSMRSGRGGNCLGCTRWNGQARDVAMHATEACSLTYGGRGVSLHGARPCIQTGSRYLEVGSWQEASVPSDLVPSGLRETPYSLDREDSDERGHVLWLSITRRRNVGVTRRTVGCRAVTRRTVGCRAVTRRIVGRGRLKVPSSGLWGREIGYCR